MLCSVTYVNALHNSAKSDNLLASQLHKITKSVYSKKQTNKGNNQ